MKLTLKGLLYFAAQGAMYESAMYHYIDNRKEKMYKDLSKDIVNMTVDQLWTILAEEDAER